jgi:two-component system sensor histidine kinase UhpB
VIPWADKLLHTLWRDRSVRAQLLIIFVVIDVIAAVAAGVVTVLQARTSTRVEIAASMELAHLLVSEAVGLMQQETPAERFLNQLASQLWPMRHVRIIVKDAPGSRLPVSPLNSISEPWHPEHAPAWFAALIAPRVESRDVPVVVNGQRIGTVEIVAEPRDEIAEVWANAVDLGAFALAANVAIIGLLYFLFGRVLDPLASLARGLGDLEQRNYRVRLSRPHARELAAITDRFNALAQALEGARAENDALTYRLITAQDDERRRTALELHDEVGPSLFGLKVNAGSIATAAAGLPHPLSDKLAGPAHDMLAIIGHLQTINRSMLNRLRPMAIGQVPLQDILADLVNDRARQHPQLSFSLSAVELRSSYGDSIDLTVYRCMQESLTNVIRHAQAKQVRIELGERPPTGQDAVVHLQLAVQDDGCGFDFPATSGFGIRGMQQRVRGLGGRYTMESEPGRGTLVRILIPLSEAKDREDERQTQESKFGTPCNDQRPDHR